LISRLKTRPRHRGRPHLQLNALPVEGLSDTTRDDVSLRSSEECGGKPKN